VPKTNQKESVTRFFNAIDNHPRSSLYILCDLVIENSVSAKQSLNDIAQIILPEQLRIITKTMTCIEANEGVLQDKNTIAAFTQFKIKLLCDGGWLKHLNPKDIIALSANDAFFLHGLIALTRVHTIAKGHTDPFHQFDFEILQRAGAEHIAPNISTLIAEAETLPLDNFKEFSKNDIELARSVLRLMQSHPTRFEMGEYFLAQHKELKDEIYTNWHKAKESIAHTTVSEENLSKHIERAAKTHSEFNNITKANRTKKDAPDKNALQKRNYSFMGLSGFGTLCVTASLVPKYTALAGAVLTSTKAVITGQAICAVGISTMAAPLIAPTSIALFLGGVTYLARHGKEASSEYNTPLEISPQLISKNPNAPE
tara:strand:- start:10949 stop:12058 length:1110 start_codon:yes stop_codon:yes gene_type:complete